MDFVYASEICSVCKISSCLWFGNDVWKEGRFALIMLFYLYKEYMHPVLEANFLYFKCDVGGKREDTQFFLVFAVYFSHLFYCPSFYPFFFFWVYFAGGGGMRNTDEWL